MIKEQFTGLNGITYTTLYYDFPECEIISENAQANGERLDYFMKLLPPYSNNSIFLLPDDTIIASSPGQAIRYSSELVYFHWLLCASVVTNYIISLERANLEEFELKKLTKARGVLIDQNLGQLLYETCSYEYPSQLASNFDYYHLWINRILVFDKSVERFFIIKNEKSVEGLLQIS